MSYLYSSLLGKFDLKPAIQSRSSKVIEGSFVLGTPRDLSSILLMLQNLRMLGRCVFSMFKSWESSLLYPSVTSELLEAITSSILTLGRSRLFYLLFRSPGRWTLAYTGLRFRVKAVYTG